MENKKRAVNSWKHFSLRLIAAIAGSDKDLKDMALRQALGESHGELMREDAMPCSRITGALAAAASVGGFICSWPLCVIFYGPRMTRPRLLRWQLCGTVGAGAAMAVYARLWEPACEPQNIAAYDKPRA